MQRNHRARRRVWRQVILLAAMAAGDWAGGAEPGAVRQADRPKPVLELRFDGDLADFVEPKRALKAHGAVAFAEGRRGKAAVFDGRSWLDTGFLQKDLGEEFTAECWVYADPRQNVYADIFGNHVGEGLGFVLQQDGSSTNQFQAAYGAGGGRWVIAPAAPLRAQRWQHVALVKTRSDLRFYLNGVLAASEQDPAPARPSAMPIAVGLGYTAPERCFRGRIDDFRLWNRAVTDFTHAAIDPAEARQVRAVGLDAAPRPAAGLPVQSWTLATADTRLMLGVTAQGELVIRELSCPAAGWNWIGAPVAFPLLPNVEFGGETKALPVRFVGAQVDDRDGRKLTLRFAADKPAVEMTSEWQAHPGPGPVRHVLQVRNRSDRPVTIGEQPTFDLDLSGAAAIWSIHSDGGTPDPVGVYRHPVAPQSGRRHTIKTSPSGEFIPYLAIDSGRQHGVYLGLEWSFCRIETVTLSGPSPAVRVRAGNLGDLRMELAPGESGELRPGFLGAFQGELDDAGNRLRRWLFDRALPEVLRQDLSYPKVQWNAFGATGKAPGSWDCVERKFYPLLDAIAPLGFEEVMIDVGWWQGSEPTPDPADWPSGMKKASQYAHEKGLRFGLYWTDNLDMARSEARQQRGDRIRRLFREHQADMWRSDCTSGEVIGASFASTRGFYALVDALAREVPGFQWENCCGGGRIKDFGAMRRAVKIFNSDTYSPLHVRQAFFDTSYVLPPVQIEGHLGSVDGRWRPHGARAMRFAFRSMSMGAPEWFIDSPSGGNGNEPWSAEEKEAVRACVATYKTRIRPLVRRADLYHILPRPDGRQWDAIEYYDPAAGKGVVYLFKPSKEVAAQTIHFKGLDGKREYRLQFEDGTHPPLTRPGSELMNQGVALRLEGDEASELIFFEVAS